MCAVYLLAGGLWLLMPFGNSSLCYKTDSGFFCWKRFGASGSFPACKTGEHVERWLLRRAGEYSRVACCGERFPTDSYKQKAMRGSRARGKMLRCRGPAPAGKNLRKLNSGFFLHELKFGIVPNFHSQCVFQDDEFYLDAFVWVNIMHFSSHYSVLLFLLCDWLMTRMCSPVLC